MKKCTLFMAVIIAMSLSASAQNDEKKPDDWKFSGQIQIRTEFDGRDLNNKTYMYNHTNSRVRFGVEKTIFKDVTGFIQVQDARLWGDEKGIGNNLKNLDLHQGYVMINNIFNVPIYAQAGRFKMLYGSARWMDYGEFGYIAKAFDGVRAGYKSDAVSFDIFSTISVPSVGIFSTAAATQYPQDAIADTSITNTGFWANFKLSKSHALSILAFNERDNKMSGYDKNVNRFTSGLSYNYNYYGFSALVEFAYQFGKVKAKDIAAYNFAAEASYNFDPIKIGILVDMFSGSKSGEDKIKTFTRTFGSGHRYFGLMDYYPSMFKNSIDPGLNDFAFNLEFKPKNNPFTFNADFHYFMTNVPFELSDKSESSAVGQEVDLRFGYQIVKNAKLELGACAFIPSEVAKNQFQVTTSKREDPGFWSYLQLKVDL